MSKAKVVEHGLCSTKVAILKALEKTIPNRKELSLVTIRETCGVTCPIVACQHWYQFMKQLLTEGLVTINQYEGKKHYMYASTPKGKKVINQVRRSKTEKSPR
jgi:hypothetical protein